MLGSSGAGASTSMLNTTVELNLLNAKNQDVLVMVLIGECCKVGFDFCITKSFCVYLCCSPWVCNCGHPWSSHLQQVVETAQPTGLIAEVISK